MVNSTRSDSIEGFSVFIQSKWGVATGLTMFSSYLTKFITAAALPTKLQIMGTIFTVVTGIVVFYLAYLSSRLPQIKSSEKSFKYAVKFFIGAIIMSTFYLFFSSAFVHTIERPNGDVYRIIEGSEINPSLREITDYKIEIINGQEVRRERSTPLGKNELYDKLDVFRVMDECYTHDAIKWEMATKTGALYLTYIGMFLLLIATFGTIMANLYVTELENKKKKDET